MNQPITKAGAPHHRTSTRRAAVLLLLALVLMWTVPSAARADSVKFGPFWHDDVTIQRVVEGEIVFRNEHGNDVTRRIEQLQGVKLDKYPALAQADDALKAGEAGRAVQALTGVREQIEEPWLQHFVLKWLVDAQAQAGQPVQAVQNYIQLISGGAHPAYWSSPPLDAVRAADDAATQQITEALNGAMSDASEQAQAQYRQLLDATQQAAAGAEDAAVVLPADMEEDNVTQLLRDGEFEQAIEDVKPTLATPGSVPRGLFQEGKAQLGIADRDRTQGDTTNMYKTAGLNFMRVVIYFPNNRYAPASLVEAGYVHAKIGRHDIARTLYERAEARLDQEQNPVYHQRVTRLMQQLPSEPEEDGSSQQR